MTDRTRNQLIFAANIAIFWPGFHLLSPITILPVFVSFLTESSILIGSVSAIYLVAYATPLIYGVRFFEGRRYKSRMLVAIITTGRIVFIAFAVILIISGGSPPELMLLLFFVAACMLGGTTGFCYPAWADTFNRVVDSHSRGRLIGIAQTIGGVMAGIIVLLATRLMGDDPFPIGFGMVFIVAALILTISYGLLIFLKEPPSPIIRSEPESIWQTGLRIPRLLRKDASFRSLLVARLLIGSGMASFGFFAVFGTRRFDLDVEHIGFLATILRISQTVANLASGFLNDRIGAIGLTIAGAAITPIAALIAFVATDPIALYPIFILVGFSQAAFVMADLTLILDTAPNDQMPTYLATYSAAVYPVLIGASAIAGVIIDVVGFKPMFLLSASLGLIGIGLMVRVARSRTVSNTTKLYG